MKIKGFTLIEMLIVVGIIGVLSLLSINGYMEYRRATILDLTVDNLISQVEQLKFRARSGEVGEEKFQEILKRLDENEKEWSEDNKVFDDLKCFGFYFSEKETGLFEVKAFSTEFDKMKKLNLSDSKWENLGCLDFSQKKDELFDLENDVKIFSENYDLNEVVVRFSPPRGDVFLSLDGGMSFFSESFDFVIAYGEKNIRELVFNVNNSKITIKR